MNAVVGQRFFSDERLGNKNDFREGFIPEFAIDFGVYEFPFGLEPTVGISYIRNSSPDCAVDSGGSCIGGVSTTDKLEYHLLGTSVGVRWRAWDPEFFLVTPFVHAAMTYRFARIVRKTASITTNRKNNGGDFGGDLQAGLLASFMWDAQRRNEMMQEWGVKDFGLNVHFRYLPAGLLKHGMGGILETGGWGMAAGLYIDW